MLLSKNALNPSLEAGESVLARGASGPLCEEAAYQQLDAYYAREIAKQELAVAASVFDDQLLGRLVDSGFTAATLPALRLAPIAFVAWASESVTEEECQAAVAAIYEAQLYQNASAIARVQGWLDVRPTKELWDLWADFTSCELSRSSASERQAEGRKLLSQATKVAIASGGLFGFGAICKAENSLLQAIRDVFFGRD